MFSTASTSLAIPNGGGNNQPVNSISFLRLPEKQVFLRDHASGLCFELGSEHGKIQCKPTPPECVPCVPASSWKAFEMHIATVVNNPLINPTNTFASAVAESNNTSNFFKISSADPVTPVAQFQLFVPRCIIHGRTHSKEYSQTNLPRASETSASRKPRKVKSKKRSIVRVQRESCNCDDFTKSQSISSGQINHLKKKSQLFAWR